MEYGDKLVKFMIPVYREYRKGFEALIATGIEIMTKFAKRSEESPLSSNYPTAVSYLALREEEPRFTDALEYVRQNKGRFFTA